MQGRIPVVGPVSGVFGRESVMSYVCDVQAELRLAVDHMLRAELGLASLGNRFEILLSEFYSDPQQIREFDMLLMFGSHRHERYLIGLAGVYCRRRGCWRLLSPLEFEGQKSQIEAYFNEAV